MNLWPNQYKYVKSKPKEFVILKGQKNTGKSEAMLHRMLNIKNNFSFEEGDRILFIVKNKDALKDIKERYLDAESNNEYMYLSLLSSKFEPEFYVLEDLINQYKSTQTLVSSKDKIRYIKEILRKTHFTNKRKFNINNIFKIIQEIKYIKNSRISRSIDFANIIEDPLRIKGKEKDISDMLILFKEYNKIIKKNSLADEEDIIIEASKRLNKLSKKYVHIFIDNAESLSSLELEFLLSIHLRKTYGTFNMCINIDGTENVYSSLFRKGKVYAKKLFGTNKKIFNFKLDVALNYLQDKNALSEIKAKEISKSSELEIVEDKFKFIDLKHRKDFSFSIEYKDDIEKVKDEYNKYKQDELEEIPVYNNIAAGEPILITPEQQDTFVLPKFWVRSGNNKFILKVKGDSMIKAGINNGDLVVIEQNPSPFNGDIVAVNIGGSATLKRLRVESDKILLIPENDDYKPIVLSKYDEFYILGKAIGIISRCN